MFVTAAAGSVALMLFWLIVFERPVTPVNQHKIPNGICGESPVSRVPFFGFSFDAFTPVPCPRLAKWLNQKWPGAVKPILAAVNCLDFMRFWR
jgi:hypothetical protein